MRIEGVGGAGQIPSPLSDSGAMAERLSRVAALLGSKLKFNVDMESGDLSVRVIDRESGRVIRVIPPEKVLETFENLRRSLHQGFDELF